MDRQTRPNDVKLHSDCKTENNLLSLMYLQEALLLTCTEKLVYQLQCYSWDTGCRTVAYLIFEDIFPRTDVWRVIQVPKNRYLKPFKMSLTETKQELLRLVHFQNSGWRPAGVRAVPSARLHIFSTWIAWFVNYMVETPENAGASPNAR